jgi:predicted RecB family endonuclease
VIRAIRVFAVLAAAAAFQAGAQPMPLVQQAEQAAPHLAALAGSEVNFRNLILGLTQGAQVAISTALPDGDVEVASFTPARPMSLSEALNALEQARLRLAAQNIVQPSAGQLGAALVGSAALQVQRVEAPAGAGGSVETPAPTPIVVDPPPAPGAPFRVPSPLDPAPRY